MTEEMPNNVSELKQPTRTGLCVSCHVCSAIPATVESFEPTICPMCNREEKTCYAIHPDAEAIYAAIVETVLVQLVSNPFYGLVLIGHKYPEPEDEGKKPVETMFLRHIENTKGADILLRSKVVLDKVITKQVGL